MILMQLDEVFLLNDRKVNFSSAEYENKEDLKTT